MSAVQLSEIDLRYGSNVVLDHVDLSVEEGEYVVILGPSGGGKTSLLRMIAGLLRPTAGVIRLRGEDVAAVPPRRRGVAFVPQQSGLYPHLPIRRSIAMGISGSVSPTARRERVLRAAELVGIESLLDRFPSQLSGGQVRRGSLAKAIARGADIRLLDEPLSAIDANLRFQIEEDLRRVHHELGGVTIHVTHDASEAMRIADRVAVLDSGSIVQFDSPQRVAAQPATPAVAGVLGQSPLRLVSVTRTADGWVTEGGSRLSGPEASERSTASVGYYDSERHGSKSGEEVLQIPSDKLFWFFR